MTSIQLIPVSKIRPGSNDRTVFDAEELQSLANSIRIQGRGRKGKGLLQPITVRKVSRHYEIIAGERRFRAVCLLQWTAIPAIPVQVTDEEAAALMMVENVSRKDLDPIDEARAFRIRIDKYGWSEETCAEYAGTSTTRVKFRLKLLTLRDDLLELIRFGHLQIGYAQTLADANLDNNRQLLAVKALRDNPKPTPGWFRNIVNQYREQQLQAGLFDASPFLVCQPAPVKTEVIEPPHPFTTTPPIAGDSPAEIIRNQVQFWTDAAQEWSAIGKPFKRQECEAAAKSLSYLLG
jgi:ParB/RepB/Spo0J family partition protein